MGCDGDGGGFGPVPIGTIKKKKPRSLSYAA